MKNKTLFAIILFLSISFKFVDSFAANSSNQIDTLLEKIHIGDDLSSVKSLFGITLKQSFEKENGQDFVVLEYLPTKSQAGERLVISFNEKTKKVVTKLWVPGFESPFTKLDKLLIDKKFSSLKMDHVEPMLCGDSPSSETFLASTDSGVLIRYGRNRREVVAVLWLSPEQYKYSLEKITQCPRK